MTSVLASLPTEGSRIAGVDSHRARASATRWLIACDDVAWADGVATALRARGASVHLLDAEGAGVQRLAMAEAEVLLLHAPPSPGLRQALDGYPGVRWAKPLVVRPLRLWPLQSEAPGVEGLFREARTAWLPDRTVRSWAGGKEPRLRVDFAALGPVRLLRALAAPPCGAFEVRLSTVDVVARITLADGHITGARYQLRASNTVCRDTPAALRHVLELSVAECEVTRLASSPAGEHGIPVQQALHEAFAWLDAQRFGALADEPTLRAHAPSQAPPAPNSRPTAAQPRTAPRPKLASPPPRGLPAAATPGLSPNLPSGVSSDLQARATSPDVEVLSAVGAPPSCPPRPLGRPLPHPPVSAAPPPPPSPAPATALAETPYPPLLRARSGLPKRWIQVGAAAVIACLTFGFLSLLGGSEEATITAEPAAPPDEVEQRGVSAAASEPARTEVEHIVEPLANEPAGVPVANPFDAVLAKGAAPAKGEPASRDEWARSRRLAREARGETKGERVRALYEQALELDPDNPRALAGLASLQLEAGELQSARKLAERAVHLRTDRYAYRMLLGRVASEQGDWDAAAVAYAEALECRPKSRAARQGLARAENGGSGSD